MWVGVAGSGAGVMFADVDPSEDVVTGGGVDARGDVGDAGDVVDDGAVVVVSGVVTGAGVVARGVVGGAGGVVEDGVAGVADVSTRAVVGPRGEVGGVVAGAGDVARGGVGEDGAVDTASGVVAGAGDVAGVLVDAMRPSNCSIFLPRTMRRALEASPEKASLSSSSCCSGVLTTVDGGAETVEVAGGVEGVTTGAEDTEGTVTEAAVPASICLSSRSILRSSTTITGRAVALARCALRAASCSSGVWTTVVVAVEVA